MGALTTVVDSVLFVLFLVIGLGAPLHDGQIFFPELYPAPLVEMKRWYTEEYGDYLYAEEPPFFVGLFFIMFVFTWPLAVASLYAIAARKPWINSTCSLFGASFLTFSGAILGELILSKRGTAQLLTIYFSFFGLSVLALFRGFFGRSEKTTVALFRGFFGRSEKTTATNLSGKSKREKRA